MIRRMWDGVVIQWMYSKQAKKYYRFSRKIVGEKKWHFLNFEMDNICDFFKFLTNTDFWRSWCAAITFNCICDEALSLWFA